ncbi:M14 family metallocarboxypeptidase [Psychrosphaera sp.]|nr:M14 family metallocarboxypeptidase [Psychrosphaera sp.]
MTEQSYSIGTPGKKWADAEKHQWLAKQLVKRSYQEQVVAKLANLSAQFETQEYGYLKYADLPVVKDADNYPLFVIKSVNWNNELPTVLITGGVHGYETSGVQGALRFALEHAGSYGNKFNFVIAPCVSPWGYETINRWNPLAVDPNRSFFEGSKAQEATLLMQYLKHNEIKPLCHIDLHETTDTDNSEFRPALASRDAIEQKNWNIPDGFYLVADSQNPQVEFQLAIIESVKKVTHIAPADESDCLIGAPLQQFGVIEYDARPLGLCMGMTDAEYKTTTEVYPDSPLVDDENCIMAQVAVITGALNHLLSR